MTQRIYKMSFSSVYPHYVAKAEKKGRTKQEVDQIARWPIRYLDSTHRRARQGQDDREDPSQGLIPRPQTKGLRVRASTRRHTDRDTGCIPRLAALEERMCAVGTSLAPLETLVEAIRAEVDTHSVRRAE